MLPLFIGLPGAGKSTTARLFAEKHGLSVLSSDPLFRVYRSIPLGRNAPGSIIMERFLGRAQRDFPEIATRLNEAAQADPTDIEGRAYLHDSERFRSFGENVFRTFEIEMLRWLVEENMFADALPDLSASAPLFEENQRLFSMDNGFLPIYLDVAQPLLLQRLFMDYKEHQRKSSVKGSPVRIRGAYELAVEKELLNRNPPNYGAWERVVLDALAKQSEKDRGQRESAYRSFCSTRISVDTETTPGEIITRVEELLENYDAQNLRTNLQVSSCGS
jgi:hypothetical protein